MGIQKIKLCNDGVDGKTEQDADGEKWVYKDQAEDIDCKCLYDLTEEEMDEGGYQIGDCKCGRNNIPKEKCDLYKEFYIIPKFILY